MKGCTQLISTSIAILRSDKSSTGFENCQKFLLASSYTFIPFADMDKIKSLAIGPNNNIRWVTVPHTVMRKCFQSRTMCGGVTLLLCQCIVIIEIPIQQFLFEMLQNWGMQSLYSLT